jgi:hypothetical protein
MRLRFAAVGADLQQIVGKVEMAGSDRIWIAMNIFEAKRRLF